MKRNAEAEAASVLDPFPDWPTDFVEADDELIERAKQGRVDVTNPLHIEGHVTDEPECLVLLGARRRKPFPSPPPPNYPVYSSYPKPRRRIDCGVPGHNPPPNLIPVDGTIWRCEHCGSTTTFRTIKFEAVPWW